MPEKPGGKGVPGEGAGTREDVRGSGIYPASGPLPKGEAPVVEQGVLGAGSRAGVPMRIRPDRCRDLMTPDPVTILPDTSAADAALLMRDRNIGFLPVVESRETQRLSGVLTDRDLALRVAAEGRDPRGTRAGQIMTGDPVTCSGDGNVESVIRLMAERRIRRIVVVDNTRRVIGVIAQADIALRAAEPDRTADLVGRVSEPDAA